MPGDFILKGALLLWVWLCCAHLFGQVDSLNDQLTPKVLHAEPLYIDLIRDLGARKGEKEWNLGYGINDNQVYDSYDLLVEYEWAVVDRLGLEVEIPFTFYSPAHGVPRDSIPANQMDAIQVAAQWSFFVSEKAATSMAIGYLHEFQLSDFNNFGNPLFSGNVFNPFFVIAKRWGGSFHTLIYTGPEIEQTFESTDLHTSFDINTSLHYMIKGTANFVGIEFNKTFDSGDFDMTMRPQMRLDIAHNFMLGIVAGIPVQRENERLSFFIRAIWEPG